jgi:flagellin-like hook-associated protein FlgL
MVGANYTAQDAASLKAASDAYNNGAADMITVQFGQMDGNGLFSPDPTNIDAVGFFMTNGNNPFGWDPANDAADGGIAFAEPGATIQTKLSLIQDLIDGNPIDPTIQASYFGGTGTNITGLKRVNTMRAEIGAMTNRLQDAVNNDQTGAANQQAAESQIRDVDFASETASFTKEQILTQSATAMLAQANSVPQSVLQLLK